MPNAFSIIVSLFFMQEEVYYYSVEQELFLIDYC